MALSSSPQFSVGAVLSTSLSVLLRNIVPFGVISIGLGIPLAILVIAGVVALPAAGIAPGVQPGNLPPGLGASLGIGVAIFFIVFLLTYFLTQTAINYGTFQDLRGQRSSIGECVSRGLGALPRVILAILALVLGFFVAGVVVALVLGLLAAITPVLSFLAMIPVFIGYIMLFLIWWVFVPVIVVEHAGPLASFGRSRELTRGHRWGILAILLLVIVGQIVVGLIVSILASVAGAVIGQIINSLVTMFFTALSGVLTAVGYYYLRAEKEGFGVDDLAKVFD